MTQLARTVTGGAVATTVVGSMTAGAPGSGGTFAITATTGWPTTGPFAVVVDRGAVSQETILCASRTGSTVTVATGGRGADGSVATSHLAGAPVEHDLDLTALTALLEHVNTDAGHDHAANYELASNVYGSTPTVLNLGQTAALGASSAFTAIGHVHAVQTQPGFAVLSAVDQSLTDNTLTVVTFATTEVDDLTGWNGTNTYTVPAGYAGVWVLNVEIEFDVDTTAGYREVQLFTGATKRGIAREAGVTEAASTTRVLLTTFIVDAAVGSTFQAKALQKNTGALAKNILSGQCRFSGRWLHPA